MKRRIPLPSSSILFAVQIVNVIERASPWNYPPESAQDADGMRKETPNNLL